MNDSKLIPPKLVELSAQHVKNTKVYANRYDALHHWPKESIVAEIGVAFGGYTDFIFSVVNPKKYDAFDTFEADTWKFAWEGKPIEEVLKGKSHYEFYIDRYKEKISKNRIEIFKGDSSTEITKINNSTYDVIYIDGDHSLNGVQKDVVASIPKLKKNGLLVFNDYIRFDEAKKPYGIIEVVNDLCVNHGWEVEYFAFQKSMYSDIALRRVCD